MSLFLAFHNVHTGKAHENVEAGMVHGMIVIPECCRSIVRIRIRFLTTWQNQIGRKTIRITGSGSAVKVDYCGNIELIGVANDGSSALARLDCWTREHPLIAPNCGLPSWQYFKGCLSLFYLVIVCGFIALSRTQQTRDAEQALEFVGGRICRTCGEGTEPGYSCNRATAKSQKIPSC